MPFGALMNWIAKIALFIAVIWGVHTFVPTATPTPLTTIVNTPVVSTPITSQVQAAVIVSTPVITETTVSATTSELFILTNNDREAQGVPPLTENATLMTDAQTRAEFFCTEPFGHFVDGKTPWEFFVGYDYHYAGENLAEGFANVPEMETAFMNSPEHEVNIENPLYTDVGIGWACGVTTVEFGSEW